MSDFLNCKSCGGVLVGGLCVECEDVPVVSGRADFTEEELFPLGGHDCFECGSVVIDRVKHTAWHNKLLP